MNPLVSVICLSYNHQEFVRTAVESVVRQTYPYLQIIVADDSSQDNSQEQIKRLKNEYPSLELLLFESNQGYCKAFNEALKMVKGKYVIDFSTDDVMMPDRIEKQVRFFESQPESVGVVFTDAVYIDQQNTVFRNHFEHLLSKGLLSSIPQGDVYQALVSRYVIASPTMMIRKKVLDELGGYDESLAYEDFDFWVRSSRNYAYAFLNEKLTQIRRKHVSLSSGLYRPGDRQLYSTYKVCKKAQQLNRSEGDRQALVRRVQYELRQSVFSGNFEEAKLFYQLLCELQPPGWVDRVAYGFARMRIPLNFVRQVYHRWRFGD